MENLNDFVTTARARTRATRTFYLNGTSISSITSTIWESPNFSTTQLSLQPAILVPASGTWAGDFVSGANQHTILKMIQPNDYWLTQSIIRGISYTSDPRWVENAVSPTATLGSLTTDSWIAPLSSVSLTGTNSYTAAADLATFIGNGNWVTYRREGGCVRIFKWRVILFYHVAEHFLSIHCRAW